MLQFKVVQLAGRLQRRDEGPNPSFPHCQVPSRMCGDAAPPAGRSPVRLKIASGGIQDAGVPRSVASVLAARAGSPRASSWRAQYRAAQASCSCIASGTQPAFHPWEVVAPTPGFVVACLTSLATECNLFLSLYCPGTT